MNQLSAVYHSHKDKTKEARHKAQLKSTKAQEKICLDHFKLISFIVGKGGSMYMYGFMK